MFFCNQIPYTYIGEKPIQVYGIFIFLSREVRHINNIKEGDLYAVLNAHGHTVELRYGYYEERDRAFGEPIPIYPDFRKHPLYTEEGYPLVTQMQELCQYGSSPYEDGCCFECRHFEECIDLIGVCKNINNKRSVK